MKNLKLTLLTIITTCLTFSCSSDDDSSSSENFAELIIGTWKWTATSENGVADTLTECELQNTITFASTTYTGVEHDNGNAPCTSYNFDGTYTIVGNTLTLGDDLEEDTEEIETLNSTTLVFEYEETFNNETTIYRDTYTRQ
ncbi:hypothetical protein GCM10023311_00830 [Flaviramulus aquimarinus]|uniref:Lipocalin-like domain-containing protein n=1 Tax=Flaviramulus aquimarinus TaxID=1170456 RepID=A0ABP9ESJ9_9FLAO